MDTGEDKIKCNAYLSVRIVVSFLHQDPAGDKVETDKHKSVVYCLPFCEGQNIHLASTLVNLNVTHTSL